MQDYPEHHVPLSQRVRVGLPELADADPRLNRWLRPSAWPYRLSYPLLGAALALGSPAGLLLLRAVLGHLDFTAPAIREEIASQPLIYGYLMGSALLVFGLLGWVLGRKEDALKTASATDPLTGLWNRRHLHARLTQEVRRATRYRTPLSLLLVDLDRLKSINDHNGHNAGDIALRRVARCLERTCRSTDIPARYGGDEFIVLVPGSDAPRALELAERILDAVRKGDPASPITVSIGVSDLAIAGVVSAEALRDSADRALYAAKAEGRDRAVIAAPE
jgi:diguanylate cyclase (GGDEF)-like protein